MKKILVLAALAIGIAGPAHAGPLIAVASWVGTILKGTTLAASLLKIAIGVGAQLLSTALAKAAAQKQKVNIQFEVEMGDDAPLSFIVGDYVTAGKRKYVGSWGPNNRHITEVIEVSCLPQAFGSMWVNDELATVLWADGIDTQHGHQPGYKLQNYNNNGFPRIWIRWVDGTQAAADPFLTGLFGNDPQYPWNASMIGTGKAYAIMTTCYDKDLLTTYPSFLFQPSPLPVYDPRRDSTAGGSGAQRWGNRATYQPSRNNAVIAYNIARGIYFGSEWVFGGRNLPAWRLPTPEWFAAMNACDATVPLAGGGTEPSFRCGLQITADMTAADVLEELGRGGNMRFAEVGGMLKPIVGLPGAAVLSITDDDILITEGQSYQPFASLSDTFNALTATYPEPAEKWGTKDAPEYTDAAFTAADGGRYLPTSIAYPAVPYGNQVQRLMRAQMRDYRRSRVHQFYLPPDAYALEPLVDMISWSSARNGYDNKLFVVENVDKTPGMNVLVTLREVDPSDYDWSSSFQLPSTVTTPVVVRPWTQGINGIAVTGVEFTDRNTKARAPAIRVSCDGGEVGVTHIQIQVRKQGETDPYLDIQRPYNDPFAWLILDVVQQGNYQARARLISTLTPRSAFTGWINVVTPAIYLDGGDFAGGITGLFTDAGLKMTRDIASRATPGAYVGELAWSRADSRLYRWNGTTWVHFIQESVQGILDETAFVQSIRVPKLVTALPTSGNRVGDMVVRQSEPSKIYTWTGSAWTAEVAADQIVGKLTAVQIGAGAIGTEQLAAGAVLARHLLVTDFTNLVPDFDLTDVGAWSIPSPWVRGLSGDNFGGQYWTFADAQPGTTLPVVRSKAFSVDVGKEYFFEVQARCDTGQTNVRISYAVEWYDRAGQYIDRGTILINSPITNIARRYSSAFVAPAGAVNARMMWTIAAGSGAGRAFIATPVARMKNSGELIVDGTLKAQHIEFETLTGGLMAPTGIITKSAQITNALIKSAHIGNAEIRYANIGVAEIDTLHLRNGSVVGGYTFNLSGENRSWNTNAEIARYTITLPEGYRGLVTFDCTSFMRHDGSAVAAIELHHNGAVIRRSQSRHWSEPSPGNPSIMWARSELAASTAAINLVPGANVFRVYGRNAYGVTYMVDVLTFKR